MHILQNIQINEYYVKQIVNNMESKLSDDTRGERELCENLIIAHFVFIILILIVQLFVLYKHPLSLPFLVLKSKTSLSRLVYEHLTILMLNISDLFNNILFEIILNLKAGKIGRIMIKILKTSET